ncbi:MAG: hypothetical protein GY950_17690 [bacterium]|nr:hypothetical protein [bacterium]
MWLFIINKVEEEKILEQKLEQAFRKTREEQFLPEDKYFKKIWDSIETRAPVCEKYYMRPFFSVLLVFLFFVVFLLLFTDFLSTLANVLTLKEIRRENEPAVQSAGSTGLEISKGIHIISIKPSKISLNRETAEQVVLDFSSGHILIKKASSAKLLIINLPGMALRIRQGECTISCYDNIVRIISLTHPVEIETEG